MSMGRALAAGVSATLAACLLAAAPALATTAFTVSGTGILHPPPYPEQLLPGYFAGDTVTRIDYPASLFGMDASIAVAATGLERAVASTSGDLIAAGFSQGAIAVGYAKEALMALPADERPAPDRLSFVTIGDPTGPGGIMRILPGWVPLIDLTPFRPPETPYDTVIVNGEYDGWADFPDRPWNLVSVINALMGIAYVHGHYEVIPGGLDISAVPAGNITTTTNSLGGTTTSYLLPTEHLPLLQPLRDIGIPEPIVAGIEQPLKAVVDAGYTRNDPQPAAARPLAATSQRTAHLSPRASAKSPTADKPKTSSPPARKRSAAS